MRKVPKEYAEILAPYVSAGLLKFVDGGKHARVERPDGHKRPIPGSPSDHRALANFRSQLKHFAGPLPEIRR
jgi:hypothetical protein